VFPMAIDRAAWIALRPRQDRRVVATSLDFEETSEFDLAGLGKKETDGWIEYLKGTAWALLDAGHALEGFEGVVAGDVPLGAGLSSSASIEMATARAFAAVTNPLVNSYKRLVPGYEAPVNLAYSSRNRSAAIRIPMYSTSPKAKRIEFRTPDPSCNGYLAFSAILMAVIDGIQNKIDPGDPLDKDIYDLPPEELAKVPHTPGSLREALQALEADHAYLLKGDVFTSDVIETWISYKMEKEVIAVELRPHPWEFALYYDI